MRHLGLAIVLTLFASASTALELEEQRTYPRDTAVKSLRILSTADAEVFEPIILAFQDLHPQFAIQYDVASSVEVMRAIYDEQAPYDLVISSAMDLQTKLANDGFAQTYQSDAIAALPAGTSGHRRFTGRLCRAGNAIQPRRTYRPSPRPPRYFPRQNRDL
jgi:iron(III) transport system substrate-binding protein